MKKILIILIFLALFSSVTFAKTILWVTQSADENQTEESYLIQKIQNDFGFNVIPIDDDRVYSNSSDDLFWYNSLKTADAVVYGEIENKYNYPDYRNAFCSNASIDKPFMMLFAMTKYNGTEDHGCPFEWGITTFNGDYNALTTTLGYIKNNQSYITENYRTDEPSNQVYIYDTDNNCSVVDSTTGIALVNAYGKVDSENADSERPTIIVWDNPRRVYFGLLKPSRFTDTSFDLFERAILWLLGEKRWKVSVTTIPENISAGKNFLLYAKITERNGTNIDYADVNFTVGTLEGNMIYDSDKELYKKENLNLQTSGEYNITIESTEAYFQKNITVGSDDVNILSGNYYPGTYLIRAKSTEGTNLSYKMFVYSNLSLISEGLLEKSGDLYEKEVSLEDYGKVILEVDSEKGGSFIIINKTETPEIQISINKEIYIPNETVKINVTGYGIENVSLNITQPDNTTLNIGYMDKTDYNLFEKSYTLAPGAINGTYTITANVTFNNQSYIYNKTFDVVLFNISYLLSKSVVRAGETTKIIIQTTRGSDPISVNYSVYFEGNVVSEGITDSNGMAEINYTTSEDDQSGKYYFDIYLWDKYHVNSKLHVQLEFNIIEVGLISVYPSEWEITDSFPGIDNMTFIVNNTGDRNITNLHILTSGNLADRITISEARTRTFLSPGDHTDFLAILNYTDLDYGEYNGTISVISDEAYFDIPVTLSLQAGSIDEVDIYPMVWKVVTVPGKEIEEEFTIKNSASRTCKNILVDLPEDIPVETVSIPSSVGPNSEGTVKFKISTENLAESSYYGNIKINCTTGYSTISITLDVLGDLPSEADQLLTEVQELNNNITKLKKMRINTTNVEKIYSEVVELLNNAKSYYENENYEMAKESYTQAQSKLSSLKSEISMLEASKPKGGSGIIWTIAFIVILIIIGVTAYIYRDKIKELIDKFLKKGGEKKEEQREERKQQEEGYYIPESEGSYRTEYY